MEASEELGITQSVISRLWQRFQGDGNCSRRYNKARTRVTTPNEDRSLAVIPTKKQHPTCLVSYLQPQTSLQWARVMFSDDESRFSLQPDTRPTFIWRKTVPVTSKATSLNFTVTLV
ncbi:cubilin [Trichonephila clavipes]|uniref:Cubilin n=1 Tax=Trichonephila clavipes TaxID=2585209 RepID=A0A8X6WHZ1_TRICX|nr:cubilin [Trichonephila clavipes]